MTPSPRPSPQWGEGEHRHPIGRGEPSTLNVGILGAGKSGVSAARLLARAGVRVLLSEKGTYTGPLPKGVILEQGGHSDALLSSNVIVRSPGVPNHLPILKKAAKRKIPLWSEIELASRFLKTAHLVAITGTNGKTTTTTLVGEIYKAWRYPALVGGNIGVPLADLAERARPSTRVVLELSSYQLEDIDRFHPRVSAILNITPDHLEHHGSMAAYAAAKARVFMNQTAKDVCVLNADDACCRRLAKRCKARVFWFSRKKSLARGIFFSNGRVHLRWNGVRAEWPLQTRLPGPHNIENVLASIALGVAGGVPLPLIRRVVERFPGVEHRLELVRRLDGVDYVNDSKGTNVDSTRVALDSFTRPLLLILGGQGKGSPYAPLRPAIRARVRQLLLIGEDAPRIRRELGGLTTTETVKTMDAAVRRARTLARPGDVVLLSPACASFDQYRNYEERGRHFKTLVRRLRAP